MKLDDRGCQQAQACRDRQRRQVAPAAPECDAGDANTCPESQHQRIRLGTAQPGVASERDEAEAAGFLGHVERAQQVHVTSKLVETEQCPRGEVERERACDRVRERGIPARCEQPQRQRPQEQLDRHQQRRE